MSRFMDDVNSVNFLNGKREVPNSHCIEKNRVLDLNVLNLETRENKINQLNQTKQYLTNQTPFNKLYVSPEGVTSGTGGQEILDVRKQILGKTLEELHTNTYQKKMLNKSAPVGAIKAPAYKRVDETSELTVFPKTDDNIECFQNYQKTVGASGYLTKSVPKNYLPDGWRPPKTTGRETLDSYDTTNLKAGFKQSLKYKDEAKGTKRETLKTQDVTNVKGGFKPSKKYTDQAKGTQRETLEGLDVTNVKGGFKQSKKYTDQAKGTQRETLEGLEVTNVKGGFKHSKKYTDQAKKTQRQTLKTVDTINLKAGSKETTKPSQHFKKTIRETLKENDITNIVGGSKSTKRFTDNAKKTIRETTRANDVTNVKGNTKQSNYFTQQAKKTQRQTLRAKDVTNVKGNIIKDVVRPKDKIRHAKYEMNIKNKNISNTGPANNFISGPQDTNASKNMFFKAAGKTEKRNRFTVAQKSKELPKGESIGKIRTSKKMDVYTLQPNLQPTQQQRAVGSGSINKCNFKSRSSKNYRTFNKGLIDGIKKTEEEYKILMNIEKQNLGRNVEKQFINNPIDTDKKKKEEKTQAQKINDLFSQSILNEMI